MGAAIRKFHRQANVDFRNFAALMLGAGAIAIFFVLNSTSIEKPK